MVLTYKPVPRSLRPKICQEPKSILGYTVRFLVPISEVEVGGGTERPKLLKHFVTALVRGKQFITYRRAGSLKLGMRGTAQG